MNMSSTQDGIAQDGIGVDGNFVGDDIRRGTVRGRLQGVLAPLRIPNVSLSNILVPALVMSGATLAAVTIAGAVKRGSPWAGINAMSAGLGLTARRPSRSFDPVLSLAGLGMAIGGSIVLAGLHGVVSRRIGGGRIGGRIGGGILTSLAAVAMDKLLMRDALFPAFKNALGVRGTMLMYGAIGAAAALAPRR